jgi:hypothetical protein
MKEFLKLLGTRQRDKVTGFIGVVGSIAFDAYGCVQAWLTPPVGKDGKTQDGVWFDVKRLEAKGGRVMPVPSFGRAGEPKNQIGPERKSAPNNV